MQNKAKEVMNDLAIDLLFWTAFWLSKAIHIVKKEEA